MKASWNVGTAKALVSSAIVAALTLVNPATSNAQTFPASVHPLNAGNARAVTTYGLSPSAVTCGVQWSATIPANSSQLWFTFDWNPGSQVVWTIMDTSLPDSGNGVSMSNISVDRNTAKTATYWITVVNTSSSTKAFNGRYCVL